MCHIIRLLHHFVTTTHELTINTQMFCRRLKDSTLFCLHGDRRRAVQADLCVSSAHRVSHLRAHRAATFSSGQQKVAAVSAPCWRRAVTAHGTSLPVFMEVITILC